ncbi:MAG: hypothetical protein ACFFDH_07230, partial [Promethearchaeota archaeon]
LRLVSFVKNFYCNLYFLETNKTLYFIDENIKISASWELDYNPANEIAYIQVQIFNSSDFKIWNSSEYDEIGLFEKNWTLNIQDLNIDFTNYTNTLYIRLFFFYFHIDTTNTMSTFLETIKVRILKKEPLCQLVGFRDHLKYGECLNFIAKFYENDLLNNSNLINHTIDFMISFNDIISHEYSYITNSSGVIDLSLSTITDLELGQNFLIFSIRENRIYNDTKFIYGIYVEKTLLMIDIINFNTTLEENEDLLIKLSYYYNINQAIQPLVNHSIQLKIFKNDTLTYINEYKTDKFGILTIKITQESFNYNQEGQNFTISLFFNGTNFLENNTLSLNLKIKQDFNSGNKNILQMRILSFISVLVVILVVISYLISEKKKRSDKLLIDLIAKF